MAGRLGTSAALCLGASCLALGCSSAGNHGPELFPIGNKAVQTGETLEFEVTAVDDDGDELEFRQGWNPEPAAPGAVFVKTDRNSARFRWTPIASDAGPDGTGLEYQVTFTVTDGTDHDSETVAVFVSLGGAGAGAPVFITPSDHVLDLDRSDTLEIVIKVSDPDSSEVDLSLVEGIAGGQFTTAPGSKTAGYVWRPTEQQAAERPVWSLRVEADDRVNPAVFQDITILLKGGQKKCEGTPPELTHTPLGDQREAGDYAVAVTVGDAESSVPAVELHYKVDPGDGSGTLQSVGLNAVGGDRWEGVIPNPGLTGEQSAVVTYTLCAQDDDDATGGECDLRACIPEDGSYSFTAYAPGSTSCDNDDLEPDETAGDAVDVVLDESGERYFEWLRICPDDRDWFRVEVPAGHRLGALLAYTEANGALEMELFDESGVSTLASGEAEVDELSLLSEVFTEARTVALRVRGADARVENGYDLVLAVDEAADCAADEYEPNDLPGDAGPIAEGVHTGLTCCGDPDFYTIELDQGDTLEVLLEFETARGDLDLWIFDEATVDSAAVLDCDNSLACGITETDDESAVAPLVAEAGTYTIAVAPYEGARNSYDLSVTVTPDTQPCTDDEFDTGGQDNGSPDTAATIAKDAGYPGLVLCPGDEDWFSLALDAGDILLAEILFSHADGDLDLKLYRDGVGPGHLVDHLLDRGMTRSDNEEVEFAAEEAGTVFLRVMGYGGAGNTYEMTVVAGQ